LREHSKVARPLTRTVLCDNGLFQADRAEYPGSNRASLSVGGNARSVEFVDTATHS